MEFKPNKGPLKRLCGNILWGFASSTAKSISIDYPPVFFCDGNTDTFTKQAFEFDEKLNQMGIPHEFCTFDVSEAVLVHGYEGQDNKYAHETRDRRIAFLKKYTGIQ